MVKQNKKITVISLFAVLLIMSLPCNAIVLGNNLSLQPEATGSGNILDTGDPIVTYTCQTTTIPEGQWLSPAITSREYLYVTDPQTGETRVARPGDLYKNIFVEENLSENPLGIFPSAFTASTIKLFRDIRKKGELEINMPHFENFLNTTIDYLETKTELTSYENDVLDFLHILDTVLAITGEDAEDKVKGLLDANLSTLTKFIPVLKNVPELTEYLSQAQGLYGEDPDLAAYFRAFRLLGFTVFSADKKEDILRGLTFYRTIYNAGSSELLAEEEHYLTDVGERNYATSLTQFLENEDPLILSALEAENLEEFVDQNLSALQEKLDGTPVMCEGLEQCSLPEGFVILSLVASLDVQEIQKRGEEEIKKATSVQDIFEKVGARYEWILEMFKDLAKKEGKELTAVEQLYRALGLMLNITEERGFSTESQDLYKMLAAVDYVLKAEETIKATQPAMIMPMAASSPTIYVPAMPTVYKALAEATKAEYNHLSEYFEGVEEIGDELKALQQVIKIFQGLYDCTKQYESNEIEQLVPIRDFVTLSDTGEWFPLGQVIMDAWIKTGMLANAKPVSAPLQFIGDVERPGATGYVGWVNFVVGGAWQGQANTIDGKRANFAMYHLMRIFSPGTESITTADLTKIINQEANGPAFLTPQGVAGLFGADYVDFFDLLGQQK